MEVFLAGFVFCHVAFVDNVSHLNKRSHFTDTYNWEELSLASVIRASVTDCPEKWYEETILGGISSWLGARNKAECLNAMKSSSTPQTILEEQLCVDQLPETQTEKDAETWLWKASVCLSPGSAAARQMGYWSPDSAPLQSHTKLHLSSDTKSQTQLTQSARDQLPQSLARHISPFQSPFEPFNHHGRCLYQACLQSSGRFSILPGRAIET